MTTTAFIQGIIKPIICLCILAAFTAAFVADLKHWLCERRTMHRDAQPQNQESEEEMDFQEFYLDLHRSATTVDYSLEEARGLYQTWQRRERVTSE